MKPERMPVAARALARHCPELVRAAPGPAELLPLLEHAGERCARLLAPALAPLAGTGQTLALRPLPARIAAFEKLVRTVPDFGAHSLLAAGEEALTLLATLDGAAVLRMVDRTFGGRGEAPVPLPAAFPVSAELLVARLETLLIAALAPVLLPARPAALAAVRRDASLARLEPFAGAEQLAVLELEATETSGETWLITLALRLPALRALLGSAPRREPGRTAEADPLAQPFGAVPLELRAVVVDMRLPMAVLAGIEPGTVLPVAVARQVPLRLGDVAIATGTVGAADDRVALQLTTTF